MPRLPPSRLSNLQTAKYDYHDQNTQQQARTTAVPFSRNIQQRDLPDQLQSAVPSCAQQCLQIYISEEYSSRCPGEGLDCMCSHYSSEGYTLGELAYVCYESSCSSRTIQQEEAVYGVCSSQTSAVSPTLGGTLTVPATTATTTPTATATINTSVTTTTAVVTPTSSISAATSSRTSTTSSHTSAALSQPSAAAASTAPSSSTSSSLSVGQAVGVSIAAFAGMAAIIAIIYFIMRCRKKARKGQKTKRSNSYDFIDDAPPRFLPSDHAKANPSGPLGIYVDQSTKSPERPNKASTRFPVIPSDPDAAERLVGQGSPPSLGIQRSNESMRTTSQLLPDKPGQTPPQRPHTLWPRPMSMKSPATVFEEDRYSRLPIQPAPPVPRPPPKTMTLPGKQVRPRPPAPVYADQYTKSPEEIRRPSLSLNVPHRARSTNKIPSAKVYVPPQPPPPPPLITAEMSSAERWDTRSSRAKSATSTAASDVLNYYASPDAGTQVARTDLYMPSSGPPTSNPLGSPLTPISLEPQHHLRSPPAMITITKPTLPPRVVGQRPYSTGSNTSFESTDPDEPTPPEEDKQLSPVAEHSPIAAIKYPKIPRSSNQSVPRSPPAQMASKFTSPRAHSRLPPRTPPAQLSPRHIPPDGRAGLPSQLKLEHRRQRSAESRSRRTSEPPGTDASALSGSTLASRRQGSSTGCEKKLVIDTSHSRANSKSNAIRPPPRVQEDRTTKRGSPVQRKRAGSRTESPLKGYGRPTCTPRNTSTSTQQVFRSPTNGLLTPEMTSPGPKVLRYANIDAGGGQGVEITQEVVLKSPLWEPKLTPRRRGDDLFLDVGMASPSRDGWGHDRHAVTPTAARETVVGHAF